MVRYMLLFIADFQGLTEPQPSGGCDDLMFSYFLKIRFENCGEKREMDVCVRLGDTIHLKPRLTHPNAASSSAANLDRRIDHLQLTDDVAVFGREKCRTHSRPHHCAHNDVAWNVRCDSCGEVRDKEIGLRLGEMVRIKSRMFHALDFLSADLDRRKAHVVLKCKLCGKNASVKMLPGYGEALTLEKSKHGDKSILMVFDCNGVEPVGFCFADGWSVTLGDGGVFNIDLSKEFIAHNEGGLICGFVSNPCYSIKEVRESQACHWGKITGSVKLQTA